MEDLFHSSYEEERAKDGMSQLGLKVMYIICASIPLERIQYQVCSRWTVNLVILCVQEKFKMVQWIHIIFSATRLLICEVCSRPDGDNSLHISIFYEYYIQWKNLTSL